MDSSSRLTAVCFLMTLSLQAGFSNYVQVRRPDLATIKAGVVGLRGRIAFQVSEVRPETPAARAGLRPNDLILAIDGSDVLDINDVRKTILDPFCPSGRAFTIKYSR